MDDVVSGYTAYAYDANGNQTRYAQYTAAGADGIWFTNDDVCTMQYTYDPSF